VVKAIYPRMHNIIPVPADIVLLMRPGQSLLVLRNSDKGILDKHMSSSWLIPQCGGIQILNLHKSSSEVVTHLNYDHLEPAMRTFLMQLLSILNLPHSPASLPICLSTLTRMHAAALVYSALNTLVSLSRLTRTLISIAIPNQVARSVNRSTSHLSSACASLKSGNFANALQETKMIERKLSMLF
jgi:GPI-anchor transamidase subunit S